MSGRVFHFATLPERQADMKRRRTVRPAYKLPEPRECAPWPPTRKGILLLAKGRAR